MKDLNELEKNMEYQRTKDGAGNIWQWYDAERVMVLDIVTGEPERFTNFLNSIGSMEDALAYVRKRVGWEDRLAIVRLQCVVAEEVDARLR